MKTCRKCGETKPLDEFHRRKDAKDGCRNDCKKCAVARVKEWGAKNPGKQLEAFRRWYKRNSATHAERTASWKKANAEKVKKDAADLRSRTRAERQAGIVKRRARKKNAAPAWADPAKIKEFYATADFLGMVTGEWHHVDHIVPLQGGTVCGLHVEHNLQVLPASANLRKGNRHWPDMP